MKKLYAVVGCLFLALAISLISVMRFSGTPPLEQHSVSVWMPKNPDLYPREAVHPGTFSFTRSLQEFQQLDVADQRVIVAYGREADGASGKWLSVVEYWRPRGDTTFDYAKVTIKDPQRSLSFLENLKVYQDVRFDKDSASFVYTLKPGDSINLWLVIALMLACGFVILGMTLYSAWRGRATAQA